MTHDKYKAALEELMACKLTEYPTLLAKFINEHYETTRSALRLAQEAEQLRKERDELASALKEYYVMYGDRSIISSVDDLLEKAGILND